MTDIFVDTNFLFHGKWIEEIPWGDLFPTSPRVFVARIVQSELDKHKSMGSSRRADRARRVLKLLRPIIDAEAESVPIGTAEIRLAAIGRIPWDEFPDLDPSKPDDQLVAEALLHRKGHPDTLVLTNDGGPIMTARHCKLDAKRVPDDWLLPPEKDDRDREIDDLRAQIREHESREPRLSAHFQQDGKSIESIELEVPIILPPREGEVRRWLELIQEKYPRQMEPPSVADLTKLDHSLRRQPEVKYDSEYSEFLDKCRQAFENLPTKIALSRMSFQFQLQIENKGAKPAEGLQIEVDCHGGVLINRSDERQERGLWIPKPPKVPRVSDFLDSQLNPSYFHDNPLLSQIRSMNRDPLYLYWEEEPKDHKFKYAELRCAEFRHGRDELVNFYGFFAEIAKDKAVIKFRVSAGNVPNSLSPVFKVSLKQYQLDLKEGLSLLAGNKGLLALAREAIDTAGPDHLPGFKMPKKS